jgi:hypothetical protein
MPSKKLTIVVSIKGLDSKALEEACIRKMVTKYVFRSDGGNDEEDIKVLPASAKFRSNKVEN